MTVLTFLLTILVLVAVHEFGHFYVARLLGVKVLRFSIGFGPVLLKWRDKLDTLYCISAIPLGGYVSMVGEDPEVPIDEADKSGAFCLRPLWQRVAVVSAGPLINLIFAFVMYWAIFMIGQPFVKPVVGQVIAESAAAQSGLQAGDLFVAIEGQPVTTWADLRLQLFAFVGEQGDVEVEVLRGGGSVPVALSFPARVLQLPDPQASVLKGIGFEPYTPPVLTVVGLVLPDSPAARAGVMVGDKLHAVFGRSISSWTQFVDLVKQHPEKEVALDVLREERLLHLKVIPEERIDSATGQTYGFVGVSPTMAEWPADVVGFAQYGLFESVGLAASKFWQIFTLNFKLLGKMVTGQLSWKNLSGPIGIAKGAKTSFDYGLVSFFRFSCPGEYEPWNFKPFTCSNP